MQFKQRTLMQIADMICGNFPAETSFFPYRSSSRLTDFFTIVTPTTHTTDRPEITG